MSTKSETKRKLTKSRRPLDKFEYSPNSRATCRLCGKGIVKKTLRAGIQNYNERYDKWNLSYYHRECVTPDQIQNLVLPSSKKRLKKECTAQDILDAELQRQQDEIEAKQTIIRERSALREILRQLRLGFARRLRVAPFRIFCDKTLDDLVAKAPRNQDEMMRCHGIGPKRFENFGGPILFMIEMFMKNYEQLKKSDGDDDGKNEIAVEEMLSVEQVVDRKFREAEENGLVISIDE